MELTRELIAIQGILLNASKKCGEFTKINYKGGNEQKILDVVEHLKTYLEKHEYFRNNSTQLENVVVFLAINTVYKKPVILGDYEHLIHIVPPLSKCLLTNILFDLNLYISCSKVVEILPLANCFEFLDELLISIKKAKPKIYLQWAYVLLKASIEKLAQHCTEVDIRKEEDNLYNLNEVLNMILHNLTGLHTNQTNLKSVQIYQHMGLTLVKLFDLLLYCDKDNIGLKKFINNVISTCSSLVKNTSVEVYCSWAEADEEDQTLQTIFSEKAYYIIEKYQKYKEAKELVCMLGTVAKKPKTITERIQEADVKTMITKINKKDINQRDWFHALLRTQVLKHKESMNCINKWSNLCTGTDVDRLLNLSLQTDDPVAKELVMKCASSLDESSLLLVISRFFHQHKFKYPFCENIDSELTVVLNKMSNNKDLDMLHKEIFMLFLKNATSVLNTLYHECLKNSFYTDNLSKSFSLLKYILHIDYIGVNTLLETLRKTKFTPQVKQNATELLDCLLEIECFTNDILLHKVLVPLLKNTIDNMNPEQEQLEELNSILYIILASKVDIVVKKENEELLNLLLNVQTTTRCTFLDFIVQRHETAAFCVDIIANKCRLFPNSMLKFSEQAEDEAFIRYYKRYLSAEENNTLLCNVCPNMNINSYGDSILDLVKILPRLVTFEWNQLSEELNLILGTQKTVDIYTSVFVLLCDFVSGINKEDQRKECESLNYCVQNFAIFIQKIIQLGCSSEENVYIARCVCKLIFKLSRVLIHAELLVLVNLVIHNCMDSLVTDKQSTYYISHINDFQIRQMLMDKVLC